MTRLPDLEGCEANLKSCFSVFAMPDSAPRNAHTTSQVNTLIWDVGPGLGLAKFHIYAEGART